MRDSSSIREETMTAYYPIYLQLQDQPCVVIGGGKIAEGKVDGLLAAKHVREDCLSKSHRIYRACRTSEIVHIARQYQPGDLTGALLVICATDQTEINHQVWQEASAHGQLVNVVDDTLRCNFIAPAILRNGDLTIAISTAAGPWLAVRLKSACSRRSVLNMNAMELAGSCANRCRSMYLISKRAKRSGTNWWTRMR
jgi:siroheme synthase-like protein